MNKKKGGGIMKRIPVLLMLVIMLVSCSSGPDVPAENKTVAEAIDPSTLLLRITGNDAAGSDVALDCRWIPAKEAVSGTLLATAEFDGYDLGSIIFESGSITYTFKGTLNGTEFIAESIAIISDELVASGPATDNATTGITINMEETGIGEGAFTAEVSADASGNASLIITGTIELPGIEGSDITIAKQDAEAFLAILEEIQRMSFAMAVEQDEYWDINYTSDKMTATLKKEYVDEATGNRFRAQAVSRSISVTPPPETPTTVQCRFTISRRNRPFSPSTSCRPTRTATSASATARTAIRTGPSRVPERTTRVRNSTSSGNMRT